MLVETRVQLCSDSKSYQKNHHINNHAKLSVNRRLSFRGLSTTGTSFHVTTIF